MTDLIIGFNAGQGSYEVLLHDQAGLTIINVKIYDHG